MYANFTFILNYTIENVSELSVRMERLEEYVDEESPFTEWSNSKRESIQE